MHCGRLCPRWGAKVVSPELRPQAWRDGRGAPPREGTDKAVRAGGLRGTPQQKVWDARMWPERWGPEGLVFGFGQDAHELRSPETERPERAGAVIPVLADATSLLLAIQLESSWILSLNTSPWEAEVTTLIFRKEKKSLWNSSVYCLDVSVKSCRCLGILSGDTTVTDLYPWNNGNGMKKPKGQKY